MSLKDVLEKLDDLLEIHKQLNVRIKLIETEVKAIKENLPGRITGLIEKTNGYDRTVGQKFRNELFKEKIFNNDPYQKGSFDERIIKEFWKKQMELEEEEEKVKKGKMTNPPLKIKEPTEASGEDE